MQGKKNEEEEERKEGDFFCLKFDHKRKPQVPLRVFCVKEE